MNNPPRQQGGFYKQAFLIAAPLVILSAFALYSLRLDRTAIEQEARDRAGTLASELAQRWSEYANESMREFLSYGRWQGLIANGQILFPLDYPPLPAPADWPDRLTPEQLRLWRIAERALFDTRDRSAARSAVSSMKSAGLPEEAIVNAQFNLLILESGKRGAPNLAHRFTDLARKYPKVSTAAGTPLADLALMQALGRTPAGSLSGSLVAELRGRVTSYPSFLTPELLQAAERVKSDWDAIAVDTWIAQERTRTLLHSLLRHPMASAPPSEIWFEAGGESFLALCDPGPGTHVAMIPAPWLEKTSMTVFLASRGRIPSYAAIEVQVGDRSWLFADGSLTQQKQDQPRSGVLASASGKLEARPRLGLPTVAFRDHLAKLAHDLSQTIQGWPDDTDINSLVPVPFLMSHPFTISITLARPDLLYAQNRQRLWLAGGLILTATAAAGIGLASAWLAYQRQQRLAEMTSNFVSSVSHELRAPLASVRLMAESLDQDRVTGDEKRKSYFRLIVQECRRLSSLVENVLDFSRIRQGRKRYDFEPVDLPALVRQTVSVMEPGAAEHQVRLILVEPAPGIEPTQPCWDGQAVQQALVNLIDNAIKHSPDGAVVKVEYVLVKTATGPRIRLAVEDRGPGIPAGEEKRIFEPFFRGGSELRRETKGVGIGLSIVKHIAEAHGGRVFVESAAGEGSQFILELPLESGMQ